MRNVEIYTRDNCVWCVRAKELFALHQINYKEYKLNVDYTKDELIDIIKRSVNVTVPQILVNGHLVGGYDNLVQYMEDHGIIGPQ